MKEFDDLDTISKILAEQLMKEHNRANAYELLRGWEDIANHTLEEPARILQVLNDTYIALHEDENEEEL
jgi:hypothetical protein